MEYIIFITLGLSLFCLINKSYFMQPWLADCQLKWADILLTFAKIHDIQLSKSNYKRLLHKPYTVNYCTQGATRVL